MTPTTQTTEQIPDYWAKACELVDRYNAGEKQLDRAAVPRRMITQDFATYTVLREGELEVVTRTVRGEKDAYYIGHWHASMAVTE